MLWCHVAKTQTVAEYYLLQCYVRFNSVKRTSTNDSRYLLSFAWMAPRPCLPHNARWCWTFTIPHNTLCPPPSPPPKKKFALTVVSKFSWEDCTFRKQYHKIIQNLGGKQTDCIWGDSEIVNWLHLKSSKVMKSWITFLKLWDLLGYFERTTSERPTCQKLALWSKLFQRY